MKGWIQWVGGSILFAVIVILYSTCNYYKIESSERQSLIYSMQDSISYFKNKQGESVSQISVLEGSKKDLLAAIGKSDARLSRLVKQNARAAASFSQVTRIDTVLITKIDTVDGIIERKSSMSDKWMTIDIREKNDSLKASVEMRDELTVSFKNVSQGFLKPKKSVVEVTNSNPHVKVQGLKSFEIPKRKSNTSVWLGLGLGVGAGYLLFK